jgi:eukaryotic-like serine/threonine-protein kinase
MDFKKFWKETFAGFILKNLLIAIGIIIVIVWGTLIGVDYYTHHGEVETVPNLKGAYIEEAAQMLARKGLTIKVIDSVYVPNRKLGTIVEQIPVANSTLKHNRPVYVIINSRQVHQIILPELSNMSYRQADAMLQSMGLSVRNVEYAPSEYKDLVIEVKFHDKNITAGSKIAEGSALVLVVGNGMGITENTIPSVKGMAIEDATQIILKDSFTIGSIEYDVAPSTTNQKQYIIYRQRPGAGAKAPTGSHIDIFMTRDKSRLNETFEEDKKTDDKDEQFF